MYSIFDYGEMIVDKVRMHPYAAALRNKINNDSIVVDIGAGTGIFSLLACQFGAKHVFAIETNDAIQIGRELARANGFSEKITFIQDLSTNISLPEKADIIISDMRGTLPLCSLHIPSIIDARNRHLEKNGTLIPLQDELFVALVESPDLYARRTAPWVNNEFGIDMSATMHWIKNTIWSNTVDEEIEQYIIDKPRNWVTLDYQTINSPNVSAEVKWQLEEDVTAHGFKIWFDALLAENIGFSANPKLGELVYGNSFFPFAEATPLKKGDIVSILIQANLVGGNYTWRWDTKISNGINPEKIITEYKQSSFNGIPLSLEQIKKRAANYKTALNDDGRRNLEIMKMIEKGFIIDDIAHELVKRYPEKYMNWQQALADVGKLSVKYSQ